MVSQNAESLERIWASRGSDQVSVMNLAEKEAYLVLGFEKGVFETYSERHGILNLSAAEATRPEWLEWATAGRGRAVSSLH